jgi:hypothetical protein
VAGFAWFVLALAPVLPYRHHSYANYLYPALPGVMLVAGDSIDGLLDRVRAATRPGTRGDAVAWAVIATLVIGSAWVTERLDTRRWSELTPGTRLPLDPALRKSELARHIVESLTPVIEGRRARIAILAPPENTLEVGIATGATTRVGAADDSDLRIAVLDGGRALRALRPQLDSVVFIPRWTPAFRDFDLVATTVDGYAIDFGQGPVAHLKLAKALFEAGNPALALSHLDAVIPSYPDDPRLAAARARVAASMSTR